MLFVVIENFRGGQVAQIYDRLRRRGRMLPEGVRYVDSWVDTSFLRCFQVMEAPDRAALDAWMAKWEDLVEFECVPVYTSAEAAALAADWESRKHLAAAPRFKPRQWTRGHGDTFTVHILQSSEIAFDAAITVRPEPTRLIGTAPSWEAAELMIGRELGALDHGQCTEACDTDWAEVAGQGATEDVDDDAPKPSVPSDIGQKT
jgi:uncharacterized protein DUF3303